MRFGVRGRWWVPAAAAVLLWGAAEPNADLIQQHRNLGKAFYENPTTQAEAVTEFKQALDMAPDSIPDRLNYALALLRAGRAAEAVPMLEEIERRDPSLPHPWFNLGIYFKQNNELAKATTQFERMIELVPNEAIGHYQLGALYRAADRLKDAEAQFQRAAELNPLLAAPHFQLFNLYRTGGSAADAARELAIFQKLKQQSEGSATPEDVDWCTYAEIYDPPRQSAPNPQIAPSYGEDHDLGPATGLLAIDSTGTGETDLLTWSTEGMKLYRHGTEPVASSGLESIKGVISAAAGDLDNDGRMDLCILTESGPLLYKNLNGKFSPFAADLPKRRFDGAVWLDYDHDYDLDLILLGEHSALMRNQGAAGFTDRTQDFPFVAGRALSGGVFRKNPESKAFDVAVDYDGRTQVAYLDQLEGRYVATAPVPSAVAPFSIIAGDFRATIENGRAHVELPRHTASDHWIRVQLAGIKSLKLAQGAQVEIKAGNLYQRQMYEGVPLVFHTGALTTVDTVRITWPNGLIQNETKQATNKSYRYEEAQRLSGSCPMIWTWNGREFQFITDVLGVAPLGASDGEGSYFPTNHVEYVQIPASALRRRNGRYEVRVTEELSEVSYIDQVQLLAVDHPASQEIFTNEKFKSPPYPEFHLYPVERRIYPEAAWDDQGRDVLPLLLARDQKYPDQFARNTLGVAQPHTLELDFAGAAPQGDAVLLLNGWVDWPDGSTFRALSQERKGGLTMPHLQMQDAGGHWVTVNEDMGMPAGKPKTIAVPLHFISASRKVRIVTDLSVYWDEIFLSEEKTGRPGTPQAESLLHADLHFRGFSGSKIDPERKQPDTFFYDRVSPVSFWNPTPGMYTRYGDVRELLAGVDDEMVLMGSGDEMTLEFDASGAPPPPGWTRDFLLKVDGWAKDRDANTAFSQTVAPLPFHAMSRYPYPAGEHFPDDDAHRRVMETYYTRPALRLIRSLKADE
jgi:tetratricopeptide (TPR) repeat protein